MPHFFRSLNHQVTEHFDAFAAVLQIASLEQLRCLEIVWQLLRKIQALGTVDASAKSVLAITRESINISCLANIRHRKPRAKVDLIACPQKESPLVLIPCNAVLLFAFAMAKVPPAMVFVFRKVDLHLVFQVEPFKEFKENGVRLLESLFSLLRVAPINHVVNSLLKSQLHENPMLRDSVLARDKSMVEGAISNKDIYLLILPCGCCHCAMAMVGVRKYLLVAAARRNTVRSELLHRITIAGRQGHMIIPIDGCGASCLESKMCHLTTREIRRTNAHTAEKNCEDQTINLITALEYEFPSTPP